MIQETVPVEDEVWRIEKAAEDTTVASGDSYTLAILT